MTRLGRSLLAIALFACASFAHAESVRLLAPAQGATLRGGTVAELHWSAADLPAGTEEWEAFLSVNGGKYYAFRVTPHLDIALQRFTFIVPNVNTNDARILIRTGDEERETHFEAPGHFSIVRDETLSNSDEVALPRHIETTRRGEAAREGDREVLSWIDGARNGSGLTERASADSPSRIPGAVTTATSDVRLVATPAATWIWTHSNESTRLSARIRKGRKTESTSRSTDLLLVCRRRNI